MSDARPVAWICTWDQLENIVKADHRGGADPDKLDRAIRIATIYAQLATAPASVGHAAGTGLEAREDCLNRINKFSDLLGTRKGDVDE